MSRLRGQLITPLIGYIVLSLGLSYPLTFKLTTTVPHDIGDPLLNTWILAWDGRAMLTEPGNLFEANIFYPLPNTLAYSEHLFSTAMLVLPLQLFFGEPVVAYNLALGSSFPLAAFGMYLLTLQWTHHRRAAFLAGVIFGLAPYRWAAIAHLQLLTWHWLPFAILFIDRLLIRQLTNDSVKRQFYALALIVFLLCQILASWYLAIYTAVIVAVYLIAAWVSGHYKPADSRWLIVSLLLTVMLTIPFAWPYLAVVDELRQARPLSTALTLAAEPTDFLAAAPFNRLFGPLSQSLRQRANFTEEHTLFLGITGPLLAVLAFVPRLVRSSRFSGTERLKRELRTDRQNRSVSSSRRRPDSSPLEGGGWVGGDNSCTLYALLIILLLTLGLTFAGPYSWLASLIPASTVIRVPARWVIPALFALAGLAAWGYHKQAPATGWPANLAFSGCLALLIAESCAVPLPLAEVDNHRTLNPAYHWLADFSRGNQKPGLVSQPGGLKSENFETVLLELPLHSAPAPEYPEVKRLYASTLGWWQLVNGYSGYTPPRQPVLAHSLASFPDETALQALQALAEVAAPQPFFLLVHPGEAPFNRRDWEERQRWQVARQPALLPIDQFAGDYLYQVRPTDSWLDQPPLAVFANQIELLAYHIQPATIAETRDRPRLLLYWRSRTSLTIEYTIFIHLRAEDGFVRHQADGPPVQGHYPTTRWQAGEFIQDGHDLSITDFDHLAIGWYDRTTGERLPAVDSAGRPLADEAVIIRVERRQ